MTTWKDGDEVDPGKARDHVKRLLEDPEHDRPKGHPDDELTRDAPLPEYGETPDDDEEE